MRVLATLVGGAVLLGAAITPAVAGDDLAADADAKLRGLELSKMVWPEVVVPLAPTVFAGRGQAHLAYELYVTNVGRSPVVLQRIQAVPESGGAALLDSSGAALSAALVHPAKGDMPEAERATLGGGERMVFYAWIDLPKGASAPAQLAHRLTFKRADDATEVVIAAAATPVVARPRTIESPLRGVNWVAANGPSNASGHRRTVIALDGQPRIAQRFAIDWVQIDKDGNTQKGDRTDNRTYFCYGQPALAVASGVVVAIKDGIPENTPESDPNAPPVSRAVPITLDTVGGNHVILDLGDGVYAFYAHLQPGSLRVKVGDRVKTGDVVGLVGNSGNSTEPHLHFHLGDRGAPLASQGLPYALPAFRVLGSSVIEGEGAPRVDWKPAGEARENEIPLENDIVELTPGR
jgi:murein DD-endopeptidase